MTCYVCGISVLAAISETLNSTDSCSSSYYYFLAAAASLLPAYGSSSYFVAAIVDDDSCSRERGADGRKNATGSALEGIVTADCSLLCFCYCYCYSFQLFAKVVSLNQLA